ncbi:hypothetical protein RM844_27670 [Streptomyces sp. DSM 44915]|uniref:Uncharacterized protein n=1 Tax=Streptomyces chisholmiae TaxID=3075540 RepID=A0ABU2JZV1_9ACTN|nr:hypothetical protein [Streptomyces sp. DSM 44915]MDT0270064.1 hypothetical protein [Streptomyces sp. DSM 44915]
MARPPDWSALNLGSDPTPGDPDRLEALIEAQKAIVDLATELDDDLDQLMRENSEFFIGETAKALREEMDDRVRKFVQSFAESHESVRTALVTYHEAMVTQQGIADGALSAVEGLDEDDDEIEVQKETAQNAGEALETAAGVAASAIQEAGSNISSMIDPCEAFWKFLQFFLIALILPAIILGGPTAILFLTLSAVLFVKTVIDYVGGRAGVTELVLSVLGMLVPTTRGLNVAGITKAINNFAGKSWAGAGHKFNQLVINGAKGSWTSLKGGGALFVKTFTHLKAGGAFANSPLALKLAWVKDFGKYVWAHFSSFKGFSAIFLPVNVTEMGAGFAGFANAFKISLWNRGVLGQYRAGAFVSGTHIVDVRAITGFDQAGRPQVNSALYAFYQPNASNTARYIATPPRHGWNDVSTAPIITIGGGFTPNSAAGSVADFSLAPPTPANSSVVSLLGNGSRSHFSSPNVSTTDVSVISSSPRNSVDNLSVFSEPPSRPATPASSISDMRPVQSIGMHFADQGRSLAPPTPVVANHAADGIPNMAGEFYVAGSPTVVTHVPAGNGQIVGVTSPMPSNASTHTVTPVTSTVSTPAATPAATAVPTPSTVTTPTGAPVVNASTTTNTSTVVNAAPTPTATPTVNVTSTTIASSAPTGSTVHVGGLNSHSNVTTSANIVSDASTTTFSPIRSEGAVDVSRTITAGAHNPTSAVNINGVTGVNANGGHLPGTFGGPQAGSFVGGQNGAPTGVNRGTGVDNVTDLNLGSVSPLPVHFADQGRGLGVPDVAQAGAGARQFTDTHIGPIEAPVNPGAQHTAPGGGPAALADDVPAVIPTAQPLQANPAGGGHLGDALSQPAAGPVARPGGGAPPAQATNDLAAPTHTFTPPGQAGGSAGAGGGGIGGAPPVRPAAGAGTFGDIASHVDGVRPVNLSAIGTRAVPTTEPLPTSAPPAATREGGEGVPPGRPSGEGQQGPGVVPVASITPVTRGGDGLATPPPPTTTPLSLTPDGPPPPVLTRGGDGAAPAAGGRAEIPAGAGQFPHRSGPLAGHTVVTPPGAAPFLVGPGGARVGGGTPLGDLGWGVIAPGQRVGAVVDGSGQRTHDLVPLGGRGERATGEYAAVPLTGDRTPVLFGKDGAPLAAPTRFLGDAFAVQRTADSAHFHDLNGVLTGASHRLPGPGGHELLVNHGTQRASVVTPDGNPLTGADARPLGDHGFLVERVGRPTILVNGDGLATHTVTKLPDQGGHPWSLAVPVPGHAGGPLLIRGADQVVPPTGGATLTPLGQHGNLVRIGSDAPLLVDDLGNVAPAVLLKNRKGAAVDLVFAPASGRAGSPAVYHTDGRLFSGEVFSGFDGRRIVVQGAGTYTVHGPDGTLLASGAGRAGGPLGEGNRLAFPEGGGRPQVVGPNNAKAPGSSATPLDGERFLIQVPGQRPGVVDASGAHTADAIRLGTGKGDPHGFVTVPRDGGAPTVYGPAGRPLPHVSVDVDGRWITLRPADSGTTTLYDLAGGFQGLRHGLPGGYQFVVAAGGGVRVLDPKGTSMAVEVSKFASGEHAVKIDGVIRLIGKDGSSTYTMRPLFGEDGRADVVVLVRPDGTVYPYPRDVDGVPLTDRVVRYSETTPRPTPANPNPERTFVYQVYSADKTVSYAADTGRFGGSAPGTAGLHKVDDIEYRGLDPADQAAVRQELLESVGRPAIRPPGLDDTDRFVFMMHGGSSSTGGAGGVPPVGSMVPVPGPAGAPATYLHISGGTLTVYRAGADGTLAPLPNAATALVDGSGFRVALPEGQFAVNKAGVRTHDVLPLGTETGRPVDFLFTPAAGGPPVLRGPAGEAKAEVPQVNGGTVDVPRGNVTHRYDLATGDWQRRTHQITGGTWANHQVTVPNPTLTPGARPTLVDNTGTQVPGVTVHELRNQDLRITTDTHGGGVVVDRLGAELGTSQRLRDFGNNFTDEYVMVPNRGPVPAGGAAAAGGPPPALQAVDGAPVRGGNVTQTGTDFTVTRTATPDTVTVHGPDGAVRHLDHGIRGGTALDGNRLIVPRQGNPRIEDGHGAAVPHTQIVPSPAATGGYLVVTGDGVVTAQRVVGVGPTGAAADVALPLGGRPATATGPAPAPAPQLTLHTGTGGAGPRVMETQATGPVQVAGAADIRVVGGDLHVVRGTHTAVHHLTDGRLLQDVHRLGGPVAAFNGADLVVPVGAPAQLERGGTMVPGSSVTDLPGDSGHVVRAGGAQQILDQHARPHPGAMDVTLPDGTAGVAVQSQRAGVPDAFVNNAGVLDAARNPRFGLAADGSPQQLTVTWQGGALDYRVTPAAGGGFTTQLTRETYPVQGGRTLEINHAVGGGTTAQFRTGTGAFTPAVHQQWTGFDGYRLPSPGAAADTVVNNRGVVTHNALPLPNRGGVRDAFVFRPEGTTPGGPVLRQPDGGAHPATTFNPGRDSYEFTTPGGVTRRHGGDGRFLEENFTVNGGQLANYQLRLPDDLGQASVRPPGGRRDTPVTAVIQTDGSIRVQHNTLHTVVNPANGTAATHDVLTLAPAGHGPVHAFTDLASGNLLPAPRAANGDVVPNTTVTRTVDNDIAFTPTGNPVTSILDGTTGAFRFTETTLNGGGAALPGAAFRTYEFTHNGQTFRGFDLLDRNRAVVDGWVVTGRGDFPTAAAPTAPDGVRMTNGAGTETWVLGANGRPLLHIGAPDATTNVRVGTVYTQVDGGPATTTTHRVIALGDGGGRRFFDAPAAGAAPGPRPVRDGELNQIGTHQVTVQGAHFRYTDHAGGLRGGEYKDYDNLGRLVEQRINIINRGQVLDGHHYKVNYTYDAAGKMSGTYEHWRPNPAWTPPAGGAAPAAGAPPRSLAPPAKGPWLDRGRVDVKGAGNGHVTLLTNNTDGLRGFVFERRPTPNGGVLDAHAPGTVEKFVKTDGKLFFVPKMRERWQELDAGGNAAGHGIRIWGTSKKTFFDYTDGWHISRSNSGPVHHYRETPQGGYVMAHRDEGGAFSYKAGERGTWYRYDADFAPLATGERRWGAFGHGWTDRILDPRSGDFTLVAKKFPSGWGHNVRNFQSFDLGKDGLPAGKGDYITVSPQGKETGVHRTDADGTWFENHRIAEQRPPNFMRWALSDNFRHVDTGAREGLHSFLPHPFFHRNHRYTTSGDHAAFMMDSRFQTFDFRRGDATGAVTERGIQGISSRGWNTVTVPTGGRISGETRPLVNGNTLTVGSDVALPPGAVLDANRLPWTEGAGKLSGHRTFDSNDFVDPPTGSNKTRDDVAWQDQFRADVPAGGNWYSRGTGHDWHIARIGFKDGTILDFRPRPAERPAGTVGDGGLTFQRDVHAGDIAGGRPRPAGYLESDWVLTNHHGKLLARGDTFPGSGVGGIDVRVVSHYKESPLGAGSIKWTADDGTSGVRKLASRNDMGHHNYFDRESFRDFIEVDGKLGKKLVPVRELRLLADNTTVVAWKVPPPAGAAPAAPGGGAAAGAGAAADTWRWNKIDRHGNIMSFGAPEQRIRHWTDGGGMRRWEDWLENVPAGRPVPAGAYTSPGGATHTVIQEIPAEVGGALRQAFNYRPLRPREYFPDPGSLGTLGRTGDDLRALGWKDFESGAVAHRKTELPDGTFLELETMAKQWRRWAYDPGTGQWTVLTERSIAGYVSELPASSFTAAATNGGTFTGKLQYTGRETYFISALNEYRGFERMYRQPRRTPWGAGDTSVGESPYTPFAVQNFQHMLLEFGQEFVLDFLVTMAVLAILPGDFGWADVGHAALSALISSSVKSATIGAHNLGAHHSQFRVGLNWQDRGFPYRFRQDDDDWAGEWASNEFVLRWRGGSYDFIRDGFFVAPLGAFLGNLAALEVFGMRDDEGNRFDISFGEAALLAAGAAASAAFGSATIGVGKTLFQGNAATRIWHRQGIVDFTIAPILSKFLEKPLGAFVITPYIRDQLGITPPPAPDSQAGADTAPPPLPDGGAVSAAMLEPPPTPEFGSDLPVLGPMSPYPPAGLPNWETTP